MNYTAKSYFLQHFTDGVGRDHIIMRHLDDTGLPPAICAELSNLWLGEYSGRADINGECKYLEIHADSDEVMIEEILARFGIWE